MITNKRTSNNKNKIYSLRKVVKIREKGGSVFELQVDHFEIYQGDFVAIVGESGCGKSTLLDMLGLVLSPSSADDFSLHGLTGNKVYYLKDASEQLLAQIRKRYIGYVLQTGGLLPFLNVRENIYLPCILNNKKDFLGHVNKIATALKIKQQLTKKPQFLSGGQRQRVAIARALAHKPSIVLADEPTAAVDKNTADNIIKEFSKLTTDLGATLLMVTHDINLVAGIANRIFSFSIENRNENYVYSRCIEIDSQEYFDNVRGKK
ncbi:MAG: ABC transporter ATP-binding protein [Chlorobi bacterium]|nr:ABC transporter ATP-binding protein [Chlorobiota bacterium]